jgi:hypothetical protein
MDKQTARPNVEDRARVADRAPQRNRKSARVAVRLEMWAESQRQQGEGKELCAGLEELLAIYRRMHSPNPDPAPHNTMLADEDVYRGVVAVTEALSREGSHEFSFIDWTSFNSSTIPNREEVRQTVARPGNEMFFP